MTKGKTFCYGMSVSLSWISCVSAGGVCNTGKENDLLYASMDVFGNETLDYYEHFKMLRRSKIKTRTFSQII